MPPRGVTRAQENRKIRQEEMREQLRAKGLLQKVIDDVDEISRLGDVKAIVEQAVSEGVEVDAAIASRRLKLDALDKATRHRLSLINKYLPDLKSSEIDMTVDDNRSVDEYSISELAALARGSEEGDRAPSRGASGSSEVH